MSVEEHIRKALKADPRPSTVIGEAAGMNPAEIRRFRTTDRSLSVASLERLAKALGLKIVVKK